MEGSSSSNSSSDSARPIPPNGSWPKRNLLRNRLSSSADSFRPGNYVVRVTVFNSAGSSHRDYSIRTLRQFFRFSSGHFVVGSALFGPPRGRPHDRLFAGNSADGRHPPPPLSLQQILLIRRLHPPSRSFGRLQYHPDVRGRGRRWKYAGQETAVPFRQRLRRRRRFALRRVFPSLTSAQSSGYSGGGKFSNSSRRMKTFLVNGCMNHITMMQVWNNYTA